MDRGKFSGKGKFFFGSLDKYEGDLSNGDINGRGKMTYTGEIGDESIPLEEDSSASVYYQSPRNA